MASGVSVTGVPTPEVAQVLAKGVVVEGGVATEGVELELVVAGQDPAVREAQVAGGPARLDLPRDLELVPHTSSTRELGQNRQAG